MKYPSPARAGALMIHLVLLELDIIVLGSDMYTYKLKITAYGQSDDASRHYHGMILTAPLYFG